MRSTSGNVLCSILQYCNVLYSTLLYGTVQYLSVQYSTVQYLKVLGCVSANKVLGAVD